MNIGRLRNRVEVQEVTKTPDGGGGHSDEWSTTKTVWAQIEPLKGNETYDFLQLTDPVTHRVIVRHGHGITSKARLKRGSVIYNVRFVRNINERDEMDELICESGVAT